MRYLFNWFTAKRPNARLPFRDGTWWRALGVSQRLSYVVGYIDASAVMKSAAIASLTGMQGHGEGHYGAVTPEALAKGLDALYAERLNRQLSLPSAIHFVWRQVAEPDADLSELLQRLRRG